MKWFHRVDRIGRLLQLIPLEESQNDTIGQEVGQVKPVLFDGRDFLTRVRGGWVGWPQALGMKVPADIHARSPRLYRGVDELTYRFQVFARQNVGVTQVGERIWLVTFVHYDLGYFDDETCRLEPIENPFGPKVLPMCSE